MSTSRHYLIIDSDLDFQAEVANHLFALGCRQIHVASRLQEALDLLNTHPIDVILAEWDLPEASGFLLLKLLRAQIRYKNLKYFLMSRADSYEPTKIIQAGSLKVDGYFLKPFSMSTLERVVG